MHLAENVDESEQKLQPLQNEFPSLLRSGCCFVEQIYMMMADHAGFWDVFFFFASHCSLCSD